MINTRESASPQSRLQSRLQSRTFRAMGSQITLWLDMTDEDLAAEAFDRSQVLFETNEQALSRFRPDSELSQLNARSGQWVEASEIMWREVRLAVRLAVLTNGRFDPTVLNALRNAGYTQNFTAGLHHKGTYQQPAAVRLVGCWAEIELDENRNALRLPAGVHLDLGGVAKGDTAQQVVDLLQAFGPCLVDAGGDLAAGASPVDYPGWPVAISSPWSPSEASPQDLVNLWLANVSLATSGIDYRHWLQNGRVMHHIIDPLTGHPADTDVITVSILADEAATADAWATATLVTGSTLGMAALQEHDLAGLMVTADGRVLVTPQMDTQLMRLSAAPTS